MQIRVVVVSTFFHSMVHMKIFHIDEYAFHRLRKIQSGCSLWRYQITFDSFLKYSKQVQNYGQFWRMDCDIQLFNFANIITCCLQPSPPKCLHISTTFLGDGAAALRGHEVREGHESQSKFIWEKLVNFEVCKMRTAGTKSILISLMPIIQNFYFIFYQQQNFVYQGRTTQNLDMFIYKYMVYDYLLLLKTLLQITCNTSSSFM